MFVGSSQTLLHEYAELRANPNRVVVPQRVRAMDFEGLEGAGRSPYVLVGLDLLLDLVRDGLFGLVDRHAIAFHPRLSHLQRPIQVVRRIPADERQFAPHLGNVVTARGG